MNIHSSDWFVPAIAGIMALWFVFNVRRRSRLTDKRQKEIHQKIIQRLAGRGLSEAEKETNTKIVTVEDWTRGRRQVLLCCGILTLVTIISFVSCVRSSS